MTIIDAPSPEGLDVRGLVHSRRTGESLPAEFYLSDEFFDADLKAIFSTQWIFVGTEAEIPDAGDYFNVELGNYSVIIIRNDDEEVGALHNVCRHRGARVLTETRGSVGNLVCGYHHWTYGTDGRLLHAAAPGPEFNPACLSLRKVAVKTVASLIFICLADEPPTDFDVVAATVAPYIEPHQLSKTKVAAQVDLIENGNWKLVMENNRECYHCDGHPELACSLFPTYGYDPDGIPPHLEPAFERYVQAETVLQARCDELGLPYQRIEELDTRVAGFRIQREALDGAGESFSLTGESVSRRLLADFPTPQLGRLSMHLQPNSWFHFLADHAIVFTAFPISASQTLVRTTWLVHEDAQVGVDYDLDELTTVWRRTNEQDAEFVARAHTGISSPAYLPGPYMPSEYQVEAFCNWYISRLRDYLDSAQR